MTKRITYLDYMRVVATFAIIILHIVAGSMTMVDLLGRDWHILNVYESIVRWGVPVFFMISGCLFLGRDINIKDIYGKYILRMAVAFLIWGLIYSLISGFGSENSSVWSLIKGAFSGYYHMWFILVIIGVYACMPFLKKIVSDEGLTKYFLIVFVIMQVIMPALLCLIEDMGSVLEMASQTAAIQGNSAANISSVRIVILSSPAIDELISIIRTFLQNVINTKPYTALGYAGYFVLGYYIDRTEIQKKSRLYIYLAGCVGALMTIMAAFLASRQAGANIDTYYGYFMPGVFLMSLAVYVWFKYNVPDYAGKKKSNGIIMAVSNLCFGVYLVHVLIIEQLYYKLGISPFVFGNLPLGVLIVGLLVFIISLAISWILHRLPFVKRYIV